MPLKENQGNEVFPINHKFLVQLPNHNISAVQDLPMLYSDNNQLIHYIYGQNTLAPISSKHGHNRSYNKPKGLFRYSKYKNQFTNHHDHLSCRR